jgi:tRNA-dihydrouridine synthase
MAPANPWIFRQIEQYRVGMDLSRSVDPASARGSSGAKAPDGMVPEIAALKRSATQNQPLYGEPSEADRYQMIRTYFQMLLEEEIHGTEGKMKQFASWFTHGVPGGATLRKAIYEAKSGAEILASVETFFENRLQIPTA